MLAPAVTVRDLLVLCRQRGNSPAVPGFGARCCRSLQRGPKDM